MNSKELNELDDWLAENVFGFSVEQGHMEYDGAHMPWRVWTGIDGVKRNPKMFSTDPAAAMMVLEKCGGKLDGDHIEYWFDGKWHCFKSYPIKENSETLPLAICLFAKALFGQKKSHCDDCDPSFVDCWNDASKCRKH